MTAAPSAFALSEKGQALWDRMDAMFERHKSMLEDSRVTVEQIDAATGALTDLNASGCRPPPWHRAHQNR